MAKVAQQVVEKTGVNVDQLVELLIKNLKGRVQAKTSSPKLDV